MFKTREEKFCKYAKEEKNREQKNNMNGHSEKYRSHEKENEKNFKTKINKLNNNEIYINEFNEYSEDGKNNENGEKSKRKENNICINKCKLYENTYIDGFKENKNISDNLKIKRKEKKYKNKFIRYYIISFYNIILNIILFSQFIKCNYRKIELASYQINLKTNGTGKINIYYSSYRVDKIIINDKINITGSDIDYFYNFNEPDNNINNVTLLWDSPLSSTNQLFKDCINIIEIDLSNFDTSSC